MKTFTASRLSEDNGLFPCKVMVSGNKITVRIPGLFNNQDKEINFDKISEVSVETPLIGYSTITFYTTGIGVVSAHGFTKSEVREIKRLIEGGADEPEAYKSVFEEDDNKQTDSIYSRDSAKIKWIDEERSEEHEEEANTKERKVPGGVTPEQHINEPKTKEVSPEILRRLEQLEKKEKSRGKTIQLKREIETSKLWLTFLDVEISESHGNPFLLYGLFNGIIDDQIVGLKGFLTSEDYVDAVEDELANKIMDLVERFSELSSKTNVDDPRKLDNVELKPAMRQAYSILKNNLKEIESAKSSGSDSGITKNFVEMKQRVNINITDALTRLFTQRERWPEEMNNDEVRTFITKLTM